jgi:hypothetical protein
MLPFRDNGTGARPAPDGPPGQKFNPPLHFVTILQ